MFRTLNMFYICLLFPLLGGMFTIECSDFVIEELNGIRYEVEVSAVPLKKEYQGLPVVPVTFSSGEKYECMLPRIEKEDLPGKVGDSEKSIDVQELLKPMYSGNCLYQIKGWWTYELCFGEHIKQFHIEDGRIYGQVLTLGKYDSEFEWNNEIDLGKFNRMKQRYHSQFYTNGTNCVLTGRARSAEVRIFCNEIALDFINLVDEPETCSYVISVHTPLVCTHPLLKLSKKAHTIPCHPILSEEKDVSYLEKDYPGEHTLRKKGKVISLRLDEYL